MTTNMMFITFKKMRVKKQLKIILK